MVKIIFAIHNPENDFVEVEYSGCHVPAVRHKETKKNV